MGVGRKGKERKGKGKGKEWDEYGMGEMNFLAIEGKGG